MIKITRNVLILSTLIATPVMADNHGYRMTTGSGAKFVYRSKPTAQENHDLCELDGKALVKSYPTHTYTCEPE